MKKDKFITVMAIFDDNMQDKMQEIAMDFERQYGFDKKTKDIPYHITLGSYAVEETDEIVSRIEDVAGKTKTFTVKFAGLNHIGNAVRYMEPEMCEELLDLHSYFDSDYANGYEDWLPHATLYIHNEPEKINLPQEILDKVNQLTDAKIVGIELGEFFPAKKIVRVLFRE